MLKFITEITYFSGLIISVWLGIFVVSRNSRQLIAWLTGLTMWSVSGLFLNVILALYPPPPPSEFPTWLRLLLPFWNEDVMSGPSNGWLQGWSVCLAVGFWHHVTTLMRPGILDPWRWTRIFGGYILGITAIFVQAFTPFIFDSIEGDPFYLNTLQAGPWYLFFIVGLVAYMTFCMINLIRSARATPLLLPRKQLYILAVATLMAGLTGPVGILSSYLGLRIPMFVLAVLLTLAMIFIGYGVANYSALMQSGRTIRRDFRYNAIAVGFVTLLYSSIAWISVEIFKVSGAIFLPIILFSIVTHSLVDFGRHSLDIILFQRKTHQIRAKMRFLTREIVNQISFSDGISLMLEELCSLVKAINGSIVLFDEEEMEIVAAYKCSPKKISQNREDLMSDDVLSFGLNYLAFPFEEICLLIPLYDELIQFGAILLGRPENGLRFSDSDIELILYPSDQLAQCLITAKKNSRQLEEVSNLLERTSNYPDVILTPMTVSQVEDALRNMTDFAYLGKHAINRMKLIRQQLKSEDTTHLDRGKVVYSTLSTTIDKLRPEGKPEKDPLPREWHPFYILHEAYLNDTPNRDIMLRLYISEGTFNRTRRAALRAVTRALGEMEAAI